MSTESSLLKAAYNLAVVADRATDCAVHQKIADIVKLHAKLAIPAAWIPMPGVDLVAASANTWAMYVRINTALDLPFSDNKLKSLASGIGTNLLSNLPVLGVASVLKVIPGIGTLGGGVIMSTTLYAVTIAAGIVYMKALATLLKKDSELTEVNLQESVDAILSDNAAVKDIIKQAMKDSRADKSKAA